MRVVPALLRDNRQFRTFFAGQAVSLVGDQISLIALPLVAVLVARRDAGPDGLPGDRGAALPNLLFSLHAGAWVDRRGRRRQMMIVADLGRAALLASVPIAYAFGALTLDAALRRRLPDRPSQRVLLRLLQRRSSSSLVPRERYVEANSLLNGSRALSSVVGPSLGGVLVQIPAAPVALVVDALLVRRSPRVALARIRPEEPPTEPAERGHLVGGDALHRRLADRSAPRSRATATINFFNFVFFALFILYANRVPRRRPGVLGARARRSERSAA